MNIWKQLRAILLLPGMVAVVIPATILYCTGVAWPPSPGTSSSVASSSSSG